MYTTFCYSHLSLSLVPLFLCLVRLAHYSSIFTDLLLPFYFYSQANSLSPATQSWVAELSKRRDQGVPILGNFFGTTYVYI